MGTRGGRPEPQAVTTRPGGRGARPGAGGNQQRPRASVPRPARPSPPPPKPAGPAAPPAWFQWVTLGLSVVGLGVASYLTFAHYTESALAACPENATFNCAKVTTSPESMVFGIFPVALLGLLFYVFMTAVCTPWAWRARGRATPPAGTLAGLAVAAIGWARLASVVIGIAFVLYLVYVELFVVNAICPWCTSVHVVTFVLFAFIVASAATWGLGRPADARQ